jgi:signal transduction histidine kinase
MNILDLIVVFQILQIPSKRIEGCQKLAAMLKVKQVFIFVKDLEVDAFLPVIGTNQTLRNGLLWQQFFLQCETAGEASDILPVDDQELMVFAIADANKLCLLAFTGGSPDASSIILLKQLLPLLVGKLVDERIVISANGHAQAAREAVKKAQELNAALDKTHFQLKSAITTAEHEISQRIVAEAKLIEADRHKNNFLATLAHELRNPLSAISMAVELQEIMNSVPSGAAGDAHKTIKRQTIHLINLVNDLLDVSRLSQGQVSLRWGPVRIGDVIDAALEMTKQSIHRHNHTLQVDVEDPDLILTGDEARLAQIVCNLLENSAKYTPKNGRLHIDVKSDKDEVVISVSDNGIGITENAHEHLFSMFSQADKVDGRVAEGLGLGLSLVKKFVELHGGQVAVYSGGQGMGSVFTIRLPIKQILA